MYPKDQLHIYRKGPLIALTTIWVSLIRCLARAQMPAKRRLSRVKMWE